MATEKTIKLIRYLRYADYLIAWSDISIYDRPHCDVKVIDGEFIATKLQLLKGI